MQGEISAALSANMEQLNSKRISLKESEAILNQDIQRKEAMLKDIANNLAQLTQKEEQLRIGI